MFSVYNFSIMLKSLAIVVFLAIVLPVYGQEKGSQTGGGKGDPNGSQNPPAAPSGTATCVVKEEGTTIECKWPEAEPQSYFKRLISPEVFPNIGVVLVGCGGIWVAVCTLRKIERQTAATEKQVDHMADSERAWLTAEVVNFPQPPPKSNMIWIEVPITNYGTTPARIKRITAIPILIDVPPRSISNRPGKLPTNPDYADTERTMNLSGFDLIIAPGQTHRDTHVFIWPKEWEQVQRKHKTLYVYGLIEYQDTVKGEPHETGFCRIYAIPEPNFDEPIGFMFSPYIPANYFRAT